MSIRASGPDAKIDQTRRKRYDAKSRNLHPLLSANRNALIYYVHDTASLFCTTIRGAPHDFQCRPSHFSLNPIPDIYIVSPPLPRSNVSPSHNSHTSRCR
ncbi:hypothetical protein K443DRAFT_676596 [Laccaria amethystina LaAM-08-1]|uniref:Uncharacterized protein n=1 Tax=Laccaria amethystina LaAM-08-1 TaxID=1095629 RepID=A0A0C9XPT7_9AGAR|nr:hypothetical protein K443DRAFT_676596 [Laccaria amethystina LaAM-08-1]